MRITASHLARRPRAPQNSAAVRPSLECLHALQAHLTFPGSHLLNKDFSFSWVKFFDTNTHIFLHFNHGIKNSWPVFGFQHLLHSAHCPHASCLSKIRNCFVRDSLNSGPRKRGQRGPPCTCTYSLSASFDRCERCPLHGSDRAAEEAVLFPDHGSRHFHRNYEVCCLPVEVKDSEDCTFFDQECLLISPRAWLNARYRCFCFLVNATMLASPNNRSERKTSRKEQNYSFSLHAFYFIRDTFRKKTRDTVMLVLGK